MVSGEEALAGEGEHSPIRGGMGRLSLALPLLPSLTLFLWQIIRP